MGISVSRCEAAEPEEQQPEEAPPAEEQPAEGGEAEEAPAEEEEEEPKHEIEVKSAPYDPRFPSTNQARHCYTRYNEFYRCQAQKGEDDPECTFYRKAYRSICPGEWVERWNEQREAGTWPGKY